MAAKVKKQTRRERVLEGMAIWGSYYRENFDVCAEEYLGFTKLKMFQKFLLNAMSKSNNFVWIAARGMGKSYLIAVFAVIYCILYPGTKVVITSGTRGQSMNVLEKIRTELVPNSPNLQNEIDTKATKYSGQDAMILFKNTSYITVATAADTARGHRATILICDEFRMIKKDILDAVLKKFLTVRRMPPYSELTEKERSAEYAKEPNKTFMLSSAYYKDHWAFEKVQGTFRQMLSDSSSDFVCGFPYELSLQEGLMFKEDIESDMLESDFNEVKFSMEMSALFWGDEDGSFFSFESIAKNRRIKYPMLPDKMATLLGNSQKISILPKRAGEIRILSADIALMASKKHKNDATAIFINQMLPTKAGRYTNNIVYADAYEGLHTDDQARIIREMYEEYNCDYIVLDCAGIGLGTFDALTRDITDPNTGEVYPALSCCNNQEMADRCPKGADKVIWAIKGNANLNSDCAILLREGFRSGKLRLLISDGFEAESALAEIKGYGSLSEQDKVKLQLPYVHTTLLVNELINLQHDETSGKVKISEKSGMRKDRYSSLSYNYYVATQLEARLRKKKQNKATTAEFLYRAPKIK